MPKKPPGKAPAVQKAGPKATEPAQPVRRAHAGKRDPQSEPGQLRRLARKLGEQEAQRLKTVDEPKGIQKLSVAPENDPLEREAEQSGARVAGGEQVRPGTISPVAPDRDRERQRAPAKSADRPESKAVQKAAREPPSAEKAVQKAPAAARQSPAELDRTAEKALSNRRAGEPLQPATRSVLESRMGVDLSDVRVHEDDAARRDAAALEARAFTYGNDIWLGPGESQGDIALMAHEATHVIQQAGGMGGMVQREGETTADDWDYEGSKGRISKSKKKIWIPVLQVPAFKAGFYPSPLTLTKKGAPDSERTDVQRANWEKAAKEGGAIAKKIDEKVQAAAAPPMETEVKPAYFMKVKEADFFLIGTKEQIVERTLRPFWDQKAKTHPFQVDHKIEVQTKPADKDMAWIDNPKENLWLLDATANMASGRNIDNEKNTKITSLLAAASSKPPKSGKSKSKGADQPADAGAEAKTGKAAPIFEQVPDLGKVRQEYEITFQEVKGGLDPAGTPDTWTLDQVKTAALQLDQLKVLTPAEIEQSGLQGSPTKLAVYTNEAGGGVRFVEDWDEKKGETKVEFTYGKRVFQVESVKYNNQTKEGSLSGIAFKGNKIIEAKAISLPIRKMGTVPHGGYIPKSDVTAAMKTGLSVPALSPIEMSEVELTDRGFVGRGKLLPTVPIIKDIGIDVVLDGDDVYLSKAFTADEFSFPGPIQVTSASLEIFAGTLGVGARGMVAFQIDRVGQGLLTAKATLTDGFSIAGDFNFDSELFDPATVHVEYSHDLFKGHGELGIPPGKVKGIKSASLKVAFEGEKIDATGSVKPTIPGIEQGDMAFHYSPETGIVISGTLALKKDIPGLAGGSVSAELAKRTGDDRWRVKASGEAVPAIPGVATKLMVTYDDGAFDAVAVAGYEKGMLKGAITLGATNRPVGEDGVPGAMPEKGADKITIYGGGSLTLRLAPWLQGTAQVRILPNGEIEVAGAIGLPSAIDIFPGKRFDKSIFKIGLDIPIVGVAVAGQRIGIFANITGGLDLSAGIGPGQLRDLHLGVTYNPAHEDQTHVEGAAQLHVPADAGLRLFVRGGLGVGIPVVSAQAGLEIGGQLGLAGALDAGVVVDWMPSRGLQIDAEGSIYVQPKFVFDITGFVLVEVDLWLTTIELYSERWKLAAFEYGSDLKFGVKFPIRYREGQPFDISLNDVTFDVPQVEPKALLAGLIDQIA